MPGWNLAWFEGTGIVRRCDLHFAWVHAFDTRRRPEPRRLRDQSTVSLAFPRCGLGIERSCASRPGPSLPQGRSTRQNCELRCAGIENKRFPNEFQISDEIRRNVSIYLTYCEG